MPTQPVSHSTPLNSTGEENKMEKLLGQDKDSLITKAKAACRGKAK